MRTLWYWMAVLLFGVSAVAGVEYAHEEAVRQHRVENLEIERQMSAAQIRMDRIVYLADTYSDGVPRHLTINGDIWMISKVQMVENDKDALAATYCKEKEIDYVEDSEEELRETIMHEVFHAGACKHGGDTWWNSPHPTNDTHPGVEHLGNFMPDFIRHNRGFVEWEMR